MTGSLILLSILASTEAFLLQGPTGPLVAQLGGSVLLPCSAETPLPLEDLEVQWRRTDSESLVYLFQQGEERPESQDYAYSGRAHFITEGVSTGNYSLLLNNVTRADAGVYICKVYTNLDSGQITAEIKYIKRLVVTGVDAVSAYVGDEAILICSVDSHMPSEKLEEVTWKRTDKEIQVLVFKDGQIVPESSHERYRGRANFFTAEIPKGNFSLRLKDIRPGDIGKYVCEAHSGHLSAKSTVVLQELVSLPLLIMACLLCIIALVLALGLGLPVFIQLNAVPRGLPAYVGKEAVLKMDLEMDPTLISVTWKKQDQVVLNYQDGVEYDFSLILTNVQPEDKGMYICEVHYRDKSESHPVELQVYDWRMMLMNCLLVFCPNIIIFIAFMLYSVKQGFVGEIATCATVNLVRFLLVFKTAPYLDILPACPKRYIKAISVMLQYYITAGVLFSGVFADISVLGINTYLMFSTGIYLFYYVIRALFFGGIQRLGYWCFTYVDIMNWTLLWLLVVGYSTFSLSMFIITLAVTLGMDVLFHFQQHIQYQKWYAIWTIMLVVLFPICIIVFFYYLYWILVNKPEGPGLMCGSALLYSLTAVSGFDHPRTTADIPIPHIFVYIFGAAALPALNAITLTTELLMEFGTGARMVSDLQVIVLPCECVFVCGWLALQPYHYWIRKRQKIKQQLKEISQKLRCKDWKSKDT